MRTARSEVWSLRRIATAMGISLCFLLGACDTLPSRVSSQENLLVTAGFTARPANTPEREAELKSLPMNRFLTRTKDNQVNYLYADPVVCNCLYVGNSMAYAAYQHAVVERRIADERRLTDEMYPAPWSWEGWSWGPWGPAPASW